MVINVNISLSKLVIGIVLYNPDLKRLSANIKSCLQQSAHIVLIDNGSNNTIQINEYYRNNSNIDIIYNKKNMGIAYALNQIMDYSLQNSFQYFLTLDQDSVMEANYLKVMSNNLRNVSDWALACPTIKDINLNKENNGKEDNNILKVDDPKSVITSGCIVKSQIAKKIGGFDNKLFIDYVDVDFNKRIQLAGYKIIRVNKAILYHELGHSEYYDFLGFKILVDHHNSVRRYYITRNRLYYSSKYFGKKGYWKERMKVWFSKVKILLFEDDKLDKLRSINRGIKDERDI